MRRTLTTLLGVGLGCVVVSALAASSTQNADPYKLGMFRQDGRDFVGVYFGSQ